MVGNVVLTLNCTHMIAVETLYVALVGRWNARFGTTRLFLAFSIIKKTHRERAELSNQPELHYVSHRPKGQIYRPKNCIQHPAAHWIFMVKTKMLYTRGYKKCKNTVRWNTSGDILLDRIIFYQKIFQPNNN